MVGQLWNSLADYYIRRGNFDKARDVYEEAILTVLTVRDFGDVFDAYAQVQLTFNVQLNDLPLMQFEETALTTEVQGNLTAVEGSANAACLANKHGLQRRRTWSCVWRGLSG